ncbi:TonB-dependent receptor [Halosquirtibacter laminarini]|uniref:TonB-dependent receptor n=1 Tax=Halosquirtibacter laminarini TaxID=3374600 RepID=A0AC61NP81_9BACT|nr:TonB-dependent receptor [Prolixibacteraceae bacterium]
MNTKNYLYLFFIFFVLSNLTAHSQTRIGEISGTVRSTNGDKLNDVYIEVKRNKIVSVTDQEGQFQIKGIPYGNYQVKLTSVGFKKKVIPLNLFDQKIDLGTITMQPSIEELDEVKIQSDKRPYMREKTEYVSKMPLKNLENPQVYSVVTSQFLEDIQATNIQSSLQNTAGVTNAMQGIGSGGLGMTLNIRGFSADIAMRNGMSTAFKTGTDPINLERIEVVKGPTGTLFGTSVVTSYGGLVNRVTKKPHAKRKGEVSYSTGSYELSRLTLDYNTPLDKAQKVLFRITSAKHAEHSFQDYGRTNSFFVNPSLTYKPNDRLQLDLETEIYNRTGPATFFNVGRAKINHLDELKYDFKKSYGSDYLNSENKAFTVFGKLTYKLSDNWKSETLISSSQTDNTTNYLFLDFFNDADSKRRIMKITSQFINTEIQQNITGSFRMAGLKNRVLIGADYTYLRTPFRRSQVIYDTIGYTAPVKDFNVNKYNQMLSEIQAFRIGQRKQQNMALYGSDIIDLTKYLSVMASIRYDHYVDIEQDYTQNQVSPKFGAVLKLCKNHLTLFGNYMSGFKNITPSITSQREVPLKPEEALQYEGGLKISLFNKKLNSTISYYNITVNDVVRWVREKNQYTQVQDGKKSSKGFEVELNAAPFQGMNVMAGYAYNKSRFIEGDKSIIGNAPYATPENSYNYWLSYKAPRGILHHLGFGFGGNYISDSYLDDRNSITVPGYSVLNASLFYDTNSMRIGLKGNNLTNQNYWANMGTYIQPQKNRNFIVTVSYKF